MHIYFTRTVPKYMRLYAHFAARQLGVHELRGSIDIHLSKGTIAGHSFGLCWGDNREAEILLGSRQFGETISQEDKLKTLGHELVHARQYLRRELIPKEGSYNTCVWKGKKYHYDPADETSQPWEVEATEWEETLYTAWQAILDAGSIRLDLLEDILSEEPFSNV